jgi:short-subunit dehydrogenase
MLSPSVICITGASSGIGAALAEAYAAPGKILFLLGRNTERLEAVANACRALGAQVHVAAIDVCDASALHTQLTTWDVMCPIDLLIANAGVSGGTLGGDEPLSQARRIFEVNVMGVLNTVQPILPRMKARGAGQVALMASLASFRHFPTAPAYSASKAAVRFYAESMAGLYAPYKIQFSAICPGYIDTPLTQKNGFYMPFLMSPARAAQRMKQQLAVGKRRIAFPKRLYIPLFLLSCLPAIWTNWLFESFPSKPQNP